MGLRDPIARLVGEQNLEFVTHARNYLSGAVVMAVIGFVSLPVLTRVLTPGEYGTLAIFLSAVSLFSLLLELNFRGAINRYYLERTDDFPDFLATNLAFLSGITVINLGLIWLIREPLSHLFRLRPEIFYLAVLCSALRLPWNLTWKLLVAQKRSGRYATLNTVRGAMQFGIGVAWIYALSRERYLGQVYANLLVAGVFALGLSAWLVGQARGGRLRREHLRYALAYGVPLVPHAMSGFVLSLFDRVIVAQIEGDASAGLYSVAHEVGSVMAVIVVSMNQAWLPIFIDYRREGKLEAIENLAAVYAKYIYFGALVLVLFAEEIGQVLAGPSFHEALPLVPSIVYAYVFIFLYTLYANYSFYTRKTWLISVATVLAGGANVGLNYWAVPSWGYAAAAWTTLASYMLLFGFHFIIARFLLREPVLRLRAVLPWLLISGAISLGLWIVPPAIGTTWVTLLAIKLLSLGLIIWLVLRARMASMGRKGTGAP